MKRLRDFSNKICASVTLKLMDIKGQGTTEYAIIVGVLAVVAIVAISSFKPKLEELWTGIADGINAL
jgi:Flp pilus assembly pilin Flp